MTQSLHEPNFLNPLLEIKISGGNVPHWEQVGKTYFLTFRLADSLPQKLLKSWYAKRSLWFKRHPKPWDEKTELTYHKTFSNQIDKWLDAGSGSCILRNSECRHELIQSLKYDDNRCYSLHAFVIMPNHVHILVSLFAATSLAQMISAWKSVSARRINVHLQKKGTVWMENYFDRLIRDQIHFRRCLRYIWENPKKAKLSSDTYARYFSNKILLKHKDLFL